jgi:hypothetical protein
MLDRRSALTLLLISACTLALPVPRAAADQPREIDETARLMAGLPLPPRSPLATRFGEDEQYIEHAQKVERRWQLYRHRTLDRLQAWAHSELALEPRVVFYPFSGPDLLNAFSFFPHARTFILVGLEAIGDVPQPLVTEPEETLASLEALRVALKPVFGMNFFRTVDIQSELRAHPSAGVAGLLLFFLARLDCEVLSARRIALGPDGQVLDFERQSRREHVWGVELRFRRRGATEERTVYYFRADLSDGPWDKHLGFARLLDRHRGMVTFLKAASYLMFKPRFNRVREAILGGSRAVVQDASGVPFKYFVEGGWALKLYGKYGGPISLFGPRDQEDLRQAMARDSRAPLPFVFGYDLKARDSHLIVATRPAHAGFLAPTAEGP